MEMRIEEGVFEGRIVSINLLPLERNFRRRRLPCRVVNTDSLPSLQKKTLQPNPLQGVILSIWAQ